MTEQAVPPEATERPERVLTGWHVLMIMLAFFGVMFAVNGVFLYHAITSFPGEDVKKSYLQGLNYNQTLAERSAQEALGWRAAAGVESGRFELDLLATDGAPVSGRRAVVELRRGGEISGDILLELVETGVGRYSAELGDLKTGRWSVRISVFEDAAEQPVFRATKTLVITP